MLTKSITAHDFSIGAPDSVPGESFPEVPEVPGVDWCQTTDAVTAFDCGSLAVGSHTAFESESGDAALPRSAFRYLTDSEQFIAEHGRQEIDVPRTYQRLRRWGPHVERITVAAGHAAIGIPSRRLRAGIRLAEGAGSYDPAAVDVVVCGAEMFVVRGTRGAFLVRMAPVRRTKVDGVLMPESPLVIDDISIPEEDPVCRRGCRRLVHALEAQLGLEPVAHGWIDDGSHQLSLANDQSIRVSGEQLQTLGTMETSSEEVCGTHSYTPRGAEPQTATIEPDDIDHDVGDEVPGKTSFDSPRGRVIGYSQTWSPRNSGSSPLELQVKYISIRHSKKGRGSDVEVLSTTEVVACPLTSGGR